MTVLAVAGCERVPAVAPPPVRAILAEVFATAAVLELGEDPQDSISSPGVFEERPEGGFLLTDETCRGSAATTKTGGWRRRSGGSARARSSFGVSAA
ncbi:hypothetical protein [Candidatus Palauibacter sp.]|uniref:hypothetical protein n=1 Tax=Candidatus Palauibacter sp. TaxID=3101350 RepID=UPI003B51A396